MGALETQAAASRAGVTVLSAQPIDAVTLEALLVDGDACEVEPEALASLRKLLDLPPGCFDGPDAAAGPRGLVVLSNGNNQAMLLNAALTRALLAAPAAFSPPLGGLDWSRVPSMDGGFSTEGMKQEEIVNLGLKDLVLQAFVKP